MTDYILFVVLLIMMSVGIWNTADYVKYSNDALHSTPQIVDKSITDDVDIQVDTPYGKKYLGEVPIRLTRADAIVMPFIQSEYTLNTEARWDTLSFYSDSMMQEDIISSSTSDAKRLTNLNKIRQHLEGTHSNLEDTFYLQPIEVGVGVNPKWNIKNTYK